MSEIENEFNFSLKMEVSIDNSFCVLKKDGNWDGIRGQLQREVS